MHSASIYSTMQLFTSTASLSESYLSQLWKRSPQQVTGTGSVPPPRRCVTEAKTAAHLVPGYSSPSYAAQRLLLTCGLRVESFALATQLLPHLQPLVYLHPPTKKEKKKNRFFFFFFCLLPACSYMSLCHIVSEVASLQARLIRSLYKFKFELSLQPQK